MFLDLWCVYTSVNKIITGWGLRSWCWFMTVNTLRQRQNGCHFADDSLKCIFLNENAWILIKISLTFAPNSPINYFSTLVWIMALRWPANKPLTELIMVRSQMHICITRPQWVKTHKMTYQQKHVKRFWLSLYQWFSATLSQINF